MTAPGIVFTVDDDGAFRTALARMLTAAGVCVQSFSKGEALLAHLGRIGATRSTACVLADLCMPGLDGLQLQEACATAGFELPFVFLTGRGDVPSAVSAMHHGAVDFLDKSAPAEVLLAALARALKRDAEASAARQHKESLHKRFNALTERERQVLAQVLHGRMNKQIAAALGIHERTVKLHRTAISTKLAVRSVAELAALANQAGFLE